MGARAYSVVVADDSKTARDIAIHALRTMGIYDIRQSPDGADALKKIAERAPDFVVLDFEMPHDGLTVLRHLRRAPTSPNRALPVLIMTAYTDRARIEALRDSGANEIISKPLSVAKLTGRVRAMMEHPRPFIDTAAYVGPERRRRGADLAYSGPFRRAADGDTFEIDVA